MTAAETATAKMTRAGAGKEPKWRCQWPGCKQLNQWFACSPGSTPDEELRRHHDASGHSAAANNRLTRGTAA